MILVYWQVAMMFVFVCAIYGAHALFYEWRATNYHRYLQYAYLAILLAVISGMVFRMLYIRMFEL